MKCPTQIEQDLFDYLSPERQAEVELHLAEDELDDETIELMVRPDPVLDEDEDGIPGERLARDGYREVDEDRLRDQAEDR